MSISITNFDCKVNQIEVQQNIEAKKQLIAMTDDLCSFSNELSDLMGSIFYIRSDETISDALKQVS